LKIARQSFSELVLGLDIFACYVSKTFIGQMEELKPGRFGKFDLSKLKNGF
jgi:hypothetical protein